MLFFGKDLKERVNRLPSQELPGQGEFRWLALEIDGIDYVFVATRKDWLHADIFNKCLVEARVVKERIDGPISRRKDNELRDRKSPIGRVRECRQQKFPRVYKAKQRKLFGFFYCGLLQIRTLVL
ncbi:hypothetical protein C4572_01785 [Candidatus Parcubacteria bacterium]|nr:MAG: hypothetical protein C4572_01785 [Candidatus Parcubacteria bacterium]